MLSRAFSIPASRPAIRRHSPAAVLVVDDERQVRESLTRVLTRHGLEVQSAENGRTALAALARAEFRAIVCDVRMEVLDGLQFYRELESARGDLTDRVVFITAWGHDPITRAALDRTGRPVLFKPFEIGVLVNLVRHVAQDRPGKPGFDSRFSAEETRRIEDAVRASLSLIFCPCCGGQLAIQPLPGGRSDIHCPRCQRRLALHLPDAN